LHLTLASTGLPFIAAQANDFSIPFPLPPSDLQGAKDKLKQRHDTVVGFLACAQEARFLNHLLGQNPIPDEGINAIILGKMAWLGQFTSFDDESLRRQRCTGSATYHPADPVFTSFFAGGQDAINRSAARFHPSCADILLSAVPHIDGLTTLTFQVNGLCMRTEVNRMISILTAPNQLGSSNLPCISGGLVETMIPPIIPHPVPKFDTEGELDVNVRDFARMFHLNKNRSILDEPVRSHIRDKLLIAWGPLGPETYSILDCGNTEHSEGTPQELLDERAFLDETLDDLGDAGLWLLKRLAILAILFNTPIATLAGALVNLLGGGAAVPALVGSPALVAAVATVGIGEIRIGETENHRLMIESSRFLKNEIILEEEADHPNIGDLKKDQAELKKWLLDYMGLIMRHDFAEYNARPYQRYSLVALLNLAVFAEDPEVRDGARMVLEFTLSKFAVGNREGVRVVPYRRLVEAMNQNPNMLEFGGRGTDHAIAMMMYYTGLVNRLPTLPPALTEQPATKALPYGNASSMIYVASSKFAPDDAIIDLAINKTVPYLQRFRSEGVEVYASTRSFTITAGGIRTPQALTLMLGPIATGIGRTTDLGTGVPTSFIPSGTPHVNRLEFMRFEGTVEDIGDVENGFGKDGRIYDHNVCVWQGFACGMNYRDMQDANPGDQEGGMGTCFVPGLDEAPAAWSFLDSRACPATRQSPPFFIARFLMPCTNADSGCLTGSSFGFFEAVDAPAVDFDTFRRKVVTDNPVVFPGNPAPEDAVNQNGHYRMFAGGLPILFSVVANRADRDLYGVLDVAGESVQNLDDWPFATGGVMNSDGNGLVSFKNPNNGRLIIWDFTDAQHPKRTPPFN
jgi:hypothetical protein